MHATEEGERRRRKQRRRESSDAGNNGGGRAQTPERNKSIDRALTTAKPKKKTNPKPEENKVSFGSDSHPSKWTERAVFHPSTFVIVPPVP